MELWMKIVQTGCPDLDVHSKVMCDHPDKTFGHPSSLFTYKIYMC